MNKPALVASVFLCLTIIFLGIQSSAQEFTKKNGFHNNLSVYLIWEVKHPEEVLYFEIYKIDSSEVLIGQTQGYDFKDINYKEGANVYKIKAIPIDDIDNKVFTKIVVEVKQKQIGYSIKDGWLEIHGSEKVIIRNPAINFDQTYHQNRIDVRGFQKGVYYLIMDHEMTGKITL